MCRSPRSGNSIDLVEHQDRRLLVAVQFGEDRVDCLDLLVRMRVARVHDVQQQPGLAGLFERRLKRCNQMVRQIADETDRIAQQNLAKILDVPLPGARVERAEELILDVHIGVRQPVHQPALASVCITDQRHRVLFGPCAGELRAPCRA